MRIFVGIKQAVYDPEHAYERIATLGAADSDVSFFLCSYTYYPDEPICQAAGPGGWIELHNKYVLSEGHDESSRQMTNLSRRYYERELSAGLGPSPSLKEHFGYSEPLRRFIQRESFEPQANQIPNTIPSWLSRLA